MIKLLSHAYQLYNIEGITYLEQSVPLSVYRI